MTTIATDGKSMAGDGLAVLVGHIVGRNHPKVQRLASGRIVGHCGESGLIELFVEWLEGGGKRPKLSGDFAALVLTPDAPARAYFGDLTSDEIDLPYAIGTGAPFALAAMDMGASPEEAIGIAAQRCCYTGGKITVLHLEKASLKAA